MNKKILVMVFGTFDYLHAGHENLFRQARELGDVIIAVVAKDKTVKAIKGHSPDHSEKERIENLKATGWADQIVLGHHKDRTKAIKEFKPDVIALGYDQFAFTYRLEKLLMDIHLNTKIVRLKPYRPDIYKSSILREKLIEESARVNV